VEEDKIPNTLPSAGTCEGRCDCGGYFNDLSLHLKLSASTLGATVRHQRRVDRFRELWDEAEEMQPKWPPPDPDCEDFFVRSWTPEPLPDPTDKPVASQDKPRIKRRRAIARTVTTTPLSY